MNRKQFIQSRGATCRNWTWSWSFINHDEQFVIFGTWDTEREKERAVILREEWEFSASHKKTTRLYAGHRTHWFHFAGI